MKQIVKHGIYIHKRECPNCKCVFTYFDNYKNNDDIDDVKYVWGYEEGKKHDWDNFKFLHKEIICPECGEVIKIKKKEDDETLLTNVDGTRLTL